LGKFLLTGMACWILATSVCGCGVYSASSGRVDQSIKHVTIPFLENLSSEPNIEIELTEAIIDAIQADNTLKVVDDDAADSILSGKVLRYRLKEAFASAQLQVDEYTVQIMVELDFTVKATGEKIFAKKRLTGTGNYILNPPDGSDPGDAGLNESDARAEAAAEIVREVLALVVEDW